MIAGVPYDAEIAFLESTGTEYIDTGKYITADTIVKVEAEVRGTGTANIGLFSAGNTAPNSEFYIWSSHFEAYWGSLSNNRVLDVSVGDRISTKIDNGSFVMSNMTTGSTATASYTFTGQSSTTAALFALHRSASQYTYLGKYRLFSAKIDTLDLIPVRVGQVGYLYDRVTRRLFGNAGTGAFVVGPDVAKPVMGVRRMASPTALSYVQNGLVAMWDGIENAGWGTHDASATTWKDLIGTRDAELTSHGSFSAISLLMDGLGYAANDGNNMSRSDVGAVEIVFKGSGDGIVSVLAGVASTNGSIVIQKLSGYLNAMIVLSAGAGLKNRILLPAGETFAVSLNYSQTDLVGAVVNGVATTTEYSFTGTAASTICFGGRAQNTDVPFGGEIYSVRVYSRALTADEIAHNCRIDKLRFGIGGAS